VLQERFRRDLPGQSVKASKLDAHAPAQHSSFDAASANQKFVRAKEVSGMTDIVAHSVVGQAGGLTYWQAGESCCDETWEAAYERFETREQQIRKFLDRCRHLGLDRLPRTSSVVELFCGHGNGLEALSRLGFEQLEGVDLSANLLARYRGPARVYVGDCRQLKFAEKSKDLVIVQGGLHHLPSLPGDLEQVLSAIHRVLRPRGSIALVEPWMTPFLRLVHAVCRQRPARRMWPKLDALAVMIEREETTYEAWLSRPAMIRQLLERFFEPELCQVSFGKILFVGHPRANA
jgi:SAM-dependent methyltransferase